jgi:hypothetical protein
MALADQTLATHHDNDLADKLANGKVDIDDVIRISESTDTEGRKLRGGDLGHTWADKIVDGVMREMDRTRDEQLTRLDYDPDTYAYVGITQDDNEDLIRQVVRFPIADGNLERSEALTAAGWMPAIFDFTGEDKHTYGVGLDSEMLAFTASALVFDLDAVSGVLLSYGEPQCFLSETPLLASGPMDSSEDGNVYAIVDANDTTAIMDLIKIAEGPIVYRRNGGMWQEDKVLLESFMSPTPPPIVELTGATKSQIITQVDANSANQLVSEDGGEAKVGEGAEVVETKPTTKDPSVQKQKARVDPKAKPEPKVKPQAAPGTPAPPENRPKRTPEDSEEGPNSKPPVTASAFDAYSRSLRAVANMRHRDTEQATRWYYSDEGYQSGYSLTAALAQIDVDAARRESTVRRAHVSTGLRHLAQQRARAAELTHVVIPALTAASKAGNEPFVHDKPGQRRAESLRKYWIRGEGAVKIRWGAEGDFTRCVRQLRKYLGARTEGWCALRHREAAGMWPGDRRNK